MRKWRLGLICKHIKLEKLINFFWYCARLIAAGCQVASQFIIFAVILVLVFSLFILSSS
jgi:hypothetical protein